MAEPSTMRPGRIPAPVGGSTAAGPAETDAPRTSGAFTTRRDRVRYVLVVAVLAVVAVLYLVTYIAQGAGEDYVQGAKGVDGGAVLMRGAYAA